MVLSSCNSCPIQGKAEKINRPAEPVYPKVWQQELACLSDETYKKLNTGKTMCRERVKTYEQVIDKYNESIK